MLIDEHPEVLIHDGLKGCVVTAYNDELWQPSDQEVRNLIEQRWKENLARNPTSFNGPQVRANQMRVNRGVLELDLQRSDYRTYAATRDVSTLPPEQRGLSVYAMIELRSADGQLVFGEIATSERQFVGMTNFFGGGVETDDVEIGSGLEKTVLRELEEETGQSRATVSGVQPSFVMRDPVSAHPTVVHVVASSLARPDMEGLFDEYTARIRAAGQKPELSKLHFVPRDALAIRRELGGQGQTRTYHVRPLILLEYCLRQLEAT